MKTALVVNPTSADGRTGRRWPRLERKILSGLKGSVEVVMTEGPGHATTLTRDFLSHGFDLIVSAGGDGTHNEVVNGFFMDDRLVNPQAAMAVINLGTGGDLARTLGWGRSLSYALERINEHQVRTIDVGVADFVGRDGNPARRYFINVADFGMGGVVVERVNRTTKVFGGVASFLWAIIITLMVYKGPTVVYRVEGGPEQTTMLFNFVMANGKYYGGGIKAAPMAELDDGVFDVVIIDKFGLLEAVVNLPRFRRGNHLHHPKVAWFQAGEVEARSDEPVWIDMDGEAVGVLPARFKVLPKTFNILV